MVALGSPRAEAVVTNRGLRERAGLCLAAAWVLVQLWHASPLPYQLESATGLALYGNASQERGLLVGFALCLAFVLFPPGRLRVPGWADAVMAIVAGVAGSSVFWNYANIVEQLDDPAVFTLAMGGCGILMLFLASLRVFGWLGAILIGLVLTLHLVPLQWGYPAPPGLRSLSGFVKVHWLGSQSIFGLLLGLLAASSFSFMLLGVGLDVIGLGRCVARRALRPLAGKVAVGELIAEHPCARHLWALAVLFCMTLPGLPLDSEHAWLWGWVAPLSVGLLAYWTSHALGTWWLGTKKNESGKRLWLVAGGMLVAAALILDAVMKIAFVAIVVAFSDLALPLSRLFTPLVWLFAFAVASILLALKAGPRAIGASALLPLGLYFWLMGVERYSPGLSGLYAVLLLLLIMLEHRILLARSEGKAPGPVPSLFLRLDFLPLCHGQARIMVRIVLLVALLSMLLPWTLHLVNLLTY